MANIYKGYYKGQELHTGGFYGPCQNTFVTKVARTRRGESYIFWESALHEVQCRRFHSHDNLFFEERATAYCIERCQDLQKTALSKMAKDDRDLQIVMPYQKTKMKDVILKAGYIHSALKLAMPTRKV